MSNIALTCIAEAIAKDICKENNIPEIYSEYLAMCYMSGYNMARKQILGGTCYCEGKPIEGYGDCINPNCDFKKSKDK
jgi:hypothetical protein